MKKILKIHPADNAIVALKDLQQGEIVNWHNDSYQLVSHVSAKHKFATKPFNIDDIIVMYGSPVGKATQSIAKGEVITVNNIRHYAAEINLTDGQDYHWQKPDVTKWQNRTFNGFVRDDGRVGTANYWLIIPLVFCQNKNAQKLQQTLSKQLGYAADDYGDVVLSLLGEESTNPHLQPQNRPFKNIDGIRVLNVNSGCGGTAFDSESLCKILAAYADHPNVAGITVFGLGCEKAQVSLFDKVLKQRNPHFNKPYLFFLQQDSHSEEEMMKEAIRQTFTQLQKVNQITRQPVPLSKLKIGVKCGGSDGFSGISANPAMGVVSDIVVALGGASILAEFPELCGAEGDIVSRCVHFEDKQHFISLMKSYEYQASQDNASISDNPSPGNIKDGLITDAIKSLGASKKGGHAPVSAVVDYGEPAPDSGLSLACTPGNDLEAVTGQVASGANLVIFSTGLGTPTGNAIAPVLKIATNTAVAKKLDYMIDFDCGPVIEGVSLQEVGEQLLERVIEAASRDYIVKADRLEQYDFLFWKRQVSL
ncbi:UxaA family hydrolase [Zophobihabitans entericus]|uniref:Altronate dehydratase n=1 Tax=Zophobihabitans entericus TaxID=1635327 RepID=A0A6G9IBG2_9GAMM|nr:altronate dehydratase family protein [Zophobihabitans entericus]QIQ20920.1 altronate dehydratase [Zophobihabitans entericus]